MITRQQALEILKENIGNENLRKHHYAVAAAMRDLQDYFSRKGPIAETAEVWEIVGLLHDADYEETKNNPKRHAAVIAEQLEKMGVEDNVTHAIKAHNYEYLDVEPQSKMDWSLIACDDLTGLIVAVALVHPNGLGDVTVESVMKKFNSPSFASGADRERIKMCEEKLGINLEEFVRVVLGAMKGAREELGL